MPPRRSRQETGIRVETKVMNYRPGDRLAESSADANRRTDRSKGDIKPARTLRQVCNHEY